MKIACSQCGSADNLEIYGVVDEFSGDPVIDQSTGKAEVKDGYCWSPDCGFKSKKWLLENADLDGVHIPVRRSGRRELSEEDITKIQEVLEKPFVGWKRRKLTRATSEFFGVRTQLDSDNIIKHRYYPSTLDGKLVGFHARNEHVKRQNNLAKENGTPKSKLQPFWPVGICNMDCDLFGQSLFPKGKKFLIIVGGEEDAMVMYQVMKSKSPKYETACVSPTVGEGNAFKQIQNNFDFVSSFETVIIMMDNDDTGRKAAKDIAKLLRPGQAKIANFTKYNDPSEYMERMESGDASDALYSVFWDAEPFSPAGIVGSNSTLTALRERASFIKIPLPTFAEDLEGMLNGGFALGEITTIAAASSIGKTTIVNEFLYHFVFNSPYKVGVISLESDVGELTENLLSLHVNKKLTNMDDDEKLAYYNSEKGVSDHRALTLDDDGKDRYYILDHQGAVVDDTLMEKVEYLVKVLGCQVIVLDPLTLALSGKQNDGMDEFMSNLLRFVKREKIHHINVVHVRKNSSGNQANSTGGTIHEEDIKGSGSIFQVSMNNILLMRDKESDDPVVRNTTKVVMSKARRTGNTGGAGYWLYDNKTSRMKKGGDPHGNFNDDEELFAEAGANEADLQKLLEY